MNIPSENLELQLVNTRYKDSSDQGDHFLQKKIVTSKYSTTQGDQLSKNKKGTCCFPAKMDDPKNYLLINDLIFFEIVTLVTCRKKSDQIVTFSD